MEFVLHCPADARWTGDESWTVQAVQNILKNCLETMSGGGVLTAEVTSDPLGWQLTVTDTGGGIAPEDLPHIFQRFYKGKKRRGKQRGHRAGLCQGGGGKTGRTDRGLQPGQGGPASRCCSPDWWCSG